MGMPKLREQRPSPPVVLCSKSLSCSLFVGFHLANVIASCVLVYQQREILYDSDYSRSLQIFGFTLDDMHTYNLQLIDYFTRVLPCRALGSYSSSLALSPQEAPSPVKSEYGSTSLPVSLSTVSSSASFYASLLPPLRDVFAYFDPAVAWAVIRPGLPDLLAEAPSGASSPVKGEVASFLRAAEASPEGKTPGKKTDAGVTEKDNKKTSTKEKEASPKTNTTSPAAPSLMLSRKYTERHRTVPLRGVIGKENSCTALVSTCSSVKVFRLCM